MLRLLKLIPMLGVMLFFLVRQFYVNLLHVDRTVFSAVFVLVMTGLGVLFFWHRTERFFPQLLLLDAIVIGQLVLATAVIGLYWLSGRTEAGMTIYALYFHAFAPFLLYAGFYFRNQSGRQVQLYLLAGSLVFTAMCVAGFFQVLGFDGWLFRNENFAFQSTFLGTHRATGGYGTQIDFGLLSFIVFVFAFYVAIERKSRWASAMVLVGLGGIFLSVSRVFIVAAGCVLLCAIRRSVMVRILKRPRLLLTVGAGLLLSVLAIQQLNLVPIFLAADKVTQSSNEDRVTFIKTVPRWVLIDYPLVGTGPGTQNGPNEEANKLIGDGLWFGMLIEFGFLAGLPLVVLKVGLVFLVVLNYFRVEHRSAIARISLALAVCFLAASFVDSAFANIVSLSIFYVVAGCFLMESYGLGRLPSVEINPAKPGPGLYSAQQAS